MPNKPTDEDRLSCIRAAIRRIEDAENRWRSSNADPSSSTNDRELAKERWDMMVAEFGWQWRNVEHFLPRLEEPKNELDAKA